jgi:hypothetical protein
VRPQRLVHYREGVRGQRVPVREHRQQHPVTGPARSPHRRRSVAGITRYGLDGMVTMPDGSRRAVTTPAAAVTVSRSPGCQPSAEVMARSATRPEESIRPNPYSTSSGAAGTSGTAATGRRRAAPVLPCSRVPGRARGGMRGAMVGAVMAASLRGEAGATQQAAGPRVRVMPGLVEISRVWVSEGGLEPPVRQDTPGITGIHRNTL